MDKSAIKSFAIEARKILMKSAITQAGFYGVSKDGCAQPTQKGAGFEVYRTIAGTDNRIFGDDIKRCEKLVRAVEEKGFDQVIEETAYTWFNRLIAIRFMEVNGYLPTRTRVLSSETGSNTPDLMSQYMDVDLDMTMEELEKVQTCVRENRYDDAFALLFVKQCNALNEILPELFEKTTDYMELLLKLSYTSDGVVRMLVDTIPESNFDIEQEGQIEIIGWMYQFYNVEPKAEVFSKNGKITKEEIPAATQLFTPDWIVRYMVENSLGRLWIEGHQDNELKKNWKYYLEEAEQEADVQVQLEEIRKEYRNLNPEDIKVIDPCMGSGHILVYCFDVLMQIYESQGYTQRDAAGLILENNLYGLDIDKRATQLAYFAVMMKARQYDRRIFAREVKPHIYAIEESNIINREQLKYFGSELNTNEKNKAILQTNKLLNTMIDAKEYGSILNVENYDWALLVRFIEGVDDAGQITLDTIGIDLTKKKLEHLIAVASILSENYNVVVTNPPYMSVSGMDSKVSDYIKQNFPDSKNDLYSVFIERCRLFNKPNGLQAMITQQAWMFTAIYEALRKKLKSTSIVSLIQLGAHAFEEISGEVVQTAAFVLRNTYGNNVSGVYMDITKAGSEREKEAAFLAHTNVFITKYSGFDGVPNASMAYWLSAQALKMFGTEKLGTKAVTREGMTTADNERFLRGWQEVSYSSIGFGITSVEKSIQSGLKWFPYNKGGTNRKWYGNNDLIVNWQNDGNEIRNIRDLKTGRIRSHNYNAEFSFRESGTWTAICSGDIMVRYSAPGALFDSKGASVFAKDNAALFYIMGLLNSKVSGVYLKVLSPAFEFKVGHVTNVPVVYRNEDTVIACVKKCVQLSKDDWDSFETSWDFTLHPLISVIPKNRLFFDDITDIDLAECFKCWENECNERFNRLKVNEEELNRIFIEIYGLQDELTPEVEDKNITVRKADLGRDIRSLLSYAVGCMFGRYSLDESGLIYAGGEWSDSKYSKFMPDKDNCIPITDEEYFEDDIVGLFCAWIKAVFGKKSLEANLDFIAKALGNKGTTSREVIRNYFLNDFMKDHMKIYQKRPIYWMFDSGKQNGFKCLIYMHRYDRDTVGCVRSDYLRKSQEAIEAALKNAEYTIQNSSSAIDKATATKKRDKYIKQLSEIRTYFQALSHVALQRIDIDLDDGVKVNYEKFQNIEIVDENGKKQKINLLAKI